MSIAARVKRFLDQNRVGYQILSYKRTPLLAEAIEKLKIPSHEMVKAIPITDGLTTILAILPWKYEIDLVSIELELQGRFHILPADRHQQFFCDCEMGCIPPLGEAYQLEVILDKSLEKLDNIYIETGSYSALLHMSMDDFRFINGGAPLFSFAYPNTNSNISSNTNSHTEANADDITRNSINETSKLHDIALTFPSLPILSQKILNLAENLMKTHRTPLLKKTSRCFKFAEFDHVALALATHQVFKLPKEVFLGSKAFWKHALYAASLSENLAKHINIPSPVNLPLNSESSGSILDPELCYLLGFTHNFGFLLFGHLFLHEFRLLSKWIQQNPNEPIEHLERRLLGMGKGVHMVGRGHTELGAWLMEYWNMPEVFVLVSEHHHASEYQGPYAYHIALIQLANQLLNSVGIGKETLSVPIEKNLRLLGISIETADAVLKDLINDPLDLRLEEIALHLAS